MRTLVHVLDSRSFIKTPLFNLGPSPFARLAVLGFLSMALMTVDHRLPHLQEARATLALVMYPIQYAVDLPIRAGIWLTEQFALRQLLIQENQRLRKEHTHLHALLLQFEALEQENARLRELLDTSQRLRTEVLIAELLAVDLDPFRQQLVLNKGRLHQVYEGQPLINAQGVVGQVLEVNALHSIAVLISDPSHALPVLVNRTGLRALAVGTGHPQRLELRYIPPSEDIEVGDTISTSGLGGRFPADYPVARITRVERVPGEAFAMIEARPFALLDRSREVLLIRPQAGDAASDDASDS